MLDDCLLIFLQHSTNSDSYFNLKNSLEEFDMRTNLVGWILTF